MCRHMHAHAMAMPTTTMVKVRNRCILTGAADNEPEAYA